PLLSVFFLKRIQAFFCPGPVSEISEAHYQLHIAYHLEDVGLRFSRLAKTRGDLQQHGIDEPSERAIPLQGGSKNTRCFRIATLVKQHPALRQRPDGRVGG